MNQPPKEKEPSFLQKLKGFPKHSKPLKQNLSSSSQQQPSSSIINTYNTSQSKNRPLLDINTWGLKRRKSKSATSTPALGSSPSSSPTPALAQALVSVSALSLRLPPSPSSGHSSGLVHPPGPVIATPDSITVAPTNEPIPHNAPITATALSASPIVTIGPPAILVQAPLLVDVSVSSESSSNPPKATNSIRIACTRTCIIWQKSLEIAEQKLLKLRLPPLDHAHLKPCSHDPGHHEESANNTVALNVQELQTTIEAKHSADSGKGIERMRDILQTFSRYAAIVDVAVGHSPHITALVWAGIRLILQVC